MTATTRVLLVGHGRMGRLVETLAPSHGCEIAGVVTSGAGAEAIGSGQYDAADVAVDFSHGSAVRSTLAALAARKINTVIGTTGWQSDEREVRLLAELAGIGVLAAANFAIGMHIFRLAAATAAQKFAGVGGVGAFIHEAHHAAKKDAPSGTALLLQRTMVESGYGGTIDVSSTRAGSIPGTHTVGFDAAAETVTLTHAVRDRAVFAHGALEAAKWLKGRRGWFTIDDMLS